MQMSIDSSGVFLSNYLIHGLVMDNTVHNRTNNGRICSGASYVKTAGWSLWPGPWRTIKEYCMEQSRKLTGINYQYFRHNTIKLCMMLSYQPIFSRASTCFQGVRKKTLQWCFEENHVAIRFNMNPLEATTTLPYLGCTVTYNNSDWDALYSNLC